MLIQNLLFELFLHNILFYLPLFQKILIILSLVYVPERDIPLLQNSKIWSILQMKTLLAEFSAGSSKHSEKLYHR